MRLAHHFRVEAVQFTEQCLGTLTVELAFGGEAKAPGRSLDQPHTKPLLDPGDQLGGG